MFFCSWAISDCTRDWKCHFQNISVRENVFLSACFCWDFRNFLREMDQKLNLVEPLVMGPRTWSLFRHFKVFRLNAILHDAAGAVRAHSGKGPGYCYMIGRGPNSCLLGHVTGLLFCLYVNVFLPSIFNSVDLWSSMSWIVLDIELTEKNVIKELGLFIDGSLQRFSICPPKTSKHNRQTTWNTSHLHIIAWSSEKFDYIQLFAVFYDIKVMNAEMSAKGLTKCRLLTTLLGQHVENLDDYGGPKVQSHVSTDSSWICARYPFRHQTSLHCSQRKAKVYVGWAMQHL